MTGAKPSPNSVVAGRYAIRSEIGRGGMATVYLADDVRHERQVAVKVLLPELSAVIGADRFNREIKVVARLQHPHILPLYDSGEEDGRLFSADFEFTPDGPWRDAARGENTNRRLECAR